MKNLERMIYFVQSVIVHKKKLIKSIKLKAFIDVNFVEQYSTIVTINQTMNGQVLRKNNSQFKDKI
ncbi:hypothetical protein RSJ15_11595 [Clostridium botulinum]|nr:hypothetical protein RSJ15_11595 [Clostridium botulinum]